VVVDPGIAMSRAAWVCALVATLNAVSWSLITPAFQVPDEQAHFAYVEQLARGHRLPTSSTQEYALDEVQALEDLKVGRVSFQPQHRTIASRALQRTLELHLARAKARVPGATGAAGTAATEPPLYYALEAIPYELAAGGNVLDQLALMRLLSATMGGATALFAFLFLREVLPSTPRAWTVGGLGVAFMPGLAFICGAVNPESMLCAVAAAIFYCLARGFRRGLTQRLALALGALIAVGFLTKLNFLGLAPAVALGFVLLARRFWQAHGRRVAARTLTPGLALAASPVLAYVVANLFSHHRALGFGSHALAQTAKRSLVGEASYIWQLYLPRLPGMRVDFADVSPIRDVWFNGLVGEYGFEDTFFPAWVVRVAVLPVLAIAALASREIVLRGAAILRRAAELGVYLGMAVGVMVLVGASSYLWFPAEAAGFPEARYLLPLIPLVGVTLGLAVRGAGRRWGAAVGVLIVVVFIAHDIFSQLQVIARYYG
jgi:4-amino-4-deoxy-L-arabinose transferase-like glycosyltransferase